MSSHRPPAPVRPSRLWLGLMTAAVTGMVAGTVAAGHASAPKVAADEHLALTPERTPEPMGHGGPLVLPSIGAVVSDPVAYLPPVPVVQTSRPARTPSEAPRGTLRVTGTPKTTPEAVSGDLGAIAGTSQPTVTTPVQTVAAATTTEATTTSATTTAETTTTSSPESTETTTTAMTSSTLDLPDELGLP